MPSRTISLAPRVIKYGIVTVTGPNARSFRITAQEYAALAMPGAGAPPGVTKQEWESGLAHAAGYDLNDGEYQVRGDGSVIIKVAEAVTVDRVRNSFLVLAAADYDVAAGKITMKPEALAKLDFTGKLARVDSLVDGVLTWQLQ